MTRLFLVALITSTTALPVFAQQATESCSMEATQIRAAVEQSTLTAEQKTQVDQTLQTAIQQEEQGNAVGCQSTVDQLKLALGIQQPAPQTQTQ